MAKHSAMAERVLESYQSATKRTSSTLRNYLGDPSNQNVHELRSAVRRLDALVRVLPTDVKKKELKSYRKSVRRVLKLTSPIRDIDLLAEKLDAAGKGSGIAPLARKTRRRRRKLVDDSMKASWKLFEEAPPSLGRKELAGVDGRARKVMIQLDSEIVRLLPKAVESEKRKDELHTMRKRCKSLRYVLEASQPAESEKKTAEVLKSWQNTLGSVRDSDVMIDYLKDEPSSAPVRRLLRGERISRSAQYRKFLGMCRAELGNDEGRAARGWIFVRHSPSAAQGKEK